MQEPLAKLDWNHTQVKILINSSQHYQSNNSLIKGKPNWALFSYQIIKNLKIPNNLYSIQAAEQTSKRLTSDYRSRASLF